MKTTNMKSLNGGHRCSFDSSDYYCGDGSLISMSSMIFSVDGLESCGKSWTSTDYHCSLGCCSHRLSCIDGSGNFADGFVGLGSFDSYGMRMRVDDGNDEMAESFQLLERSLK